ncbi:hypothetical protein [Actinomyces urinae]|uniref:hypothetical protein n=1 Tax=Actinomyces urinae TaxID=1689268 RepID=UPI0009300D66|nr:hypothetical protein [Actinomyces urinae]
MFDLAGVILDAAGREPAAAPALALRCVPLVDLRVEELPLLPEEDWDLENELPDVDLREADGREDFADLLPPLWGQISQSPRPLPLPFFGATS